MPAGGYNTGEGIELSAAEFLDAIAPLVERAPQLFHAFTIVTNARPGALGKSLGTVGPTLRHTKNISIVVRVHREAISWPPGYAILRRVSFSGRITRAHES